MAHGTVWSFSPSRMQQRTTVAGLGLDLHLGPRVEVGAGRLEEGDARTRHRVRVEQLVGLVLADGVGEGVAELVVGERDGPMVVGGVAEHRVWPT